MPTYMITDGDSNQLCDGVSEHDLERVAQGWANRLGITVYAYSSEPAEIPGHITAPYPFEPEDT